MAAVPTSTAKTQPPWQTIDLPDSQADWIARAAGVGAVLSADATVRDRVARAPTAEVALLKDSGLATLLGPREAGGGGADWATAYAVTREVANLYLGIEQGALTAATEYTRTHTRHDPLAYKLRELGEFVLNDRIPGPGWYS